MKFMIESEPEEAGRWLAEALELPGVLAYGATARDAIANLARDEGAACSRRVVGARLASQASNRLASNFGARRLG
jgi:hypothetical protein